jgi:hypothetical protein
MVSGSAGINPVQTRYTIEDTRALAHVFLRPISIAQQCGNGNAVKAMLMGDAGRCDQGLLVSKLRIASRFEKPSKA